MCERPERRWSPRPEEGSFCGGLPKTRFKNLEKRGEPQTDMTIYSPINGVVTKKEGTQGMRVTPEMTLYEIADLSTVWVLADVYEYELSYIKKGQEANITVAAYPGEQLFTGRSLSSIPS
ncbi:MAG: efflux RND transporter periplasmic adaptor subunit (plasmid) [Candidatus Manganitrophus sp.]|nr:MAG: efflux RND transporter periplasmic adaptor subunit [Candidatus Manganitrophus sp.]